MPARVRSDLERSEIVASHDPRLAVFKQGVFVGFISRKGDRGAEFRYAESYLQKPVCGPLSASLPLHPSTEERAAFSQDDGLPIYFANILPGNDRLKQQAGRLGVEKPDHERAIKGDEFSILGELGGDTVGDVTVYSQSALRQRQLQSLATDDPRADAVRGAGDTHVSIRRDLKHRTQSSTISGDQPKVFSTRTSSIIKPETPDYPGAARNEFLCTIYARRAGIRTIDARVIDMTDGTHALVSQRFDRGHSLVKYGPQGRRTVAFAVEDGCQVLDLHPIDRRETTVENLITALAERCTVPEDAKRVFFRQFAFAYLTGNGDQHAKNFSIVSHGELTEPSPSYDNLCTMVYDGRYKDCTTSLPVMPAEGEERLPRYRMNFSGKTFTRLGEQLDIPRDEVAQILNEVATATLGFIDDPQVVELFQGGAGGRKYKDARTQLLSRHASLALGLPELDGVSSVATERRKNRPELAAGSRDI